MAEQLEDRSREERSLRELLDKIAHPLLDVRTRALRSVTFKLSSGLVAKSDLVHERSFLAGLLEWFNFQEWALESQALRLLAQLAEHEAAAVTLVDIGGVEFLSQLRLHCDPSLHPLIDEILELLMKLPPSAVEGKTPNSGSNHPSLQTQNVETSSVDTEVHTSSITKHAVAVTGGVLASSSAPVGLASPSGVGVVSISVPHGVGSVSSFSQQTFTTESTSDLGSYMHISSPTGLPLHLHLPQQYLPHSGSVTSSPETLTHSSSSLHSLGSVVVSHHQKVLAGSGYLVPTAVGVNEAGLRGPDGVNYGEVSELHTVGFQASRSEEHTNRQGCAGDGKKTGVFPWLLLSKNDRHILATTESRLKSPNAESQVRVCEFLQGVLFRDFPAEVFIQRPFIVKHLLMLLEGPGVTSKLLRCALRCFGELTGCLRRRLSVLCDSSVGIVDAHTVNEEHLKVGETLQVGNDLAACRPQGECLAGGLEVLTTEMLEQLQLEQLMLMDFCHLTLAHVVSLLLTYLNRDFPCQLEERVCSSRPVGFYLILCLQLIESVMELMWAVKRWTVTCQEQSSDSGGSHAAHSVDTIVSTLSHCLSKWRRLSTAQPRPSTQQLQPLYTITVFLGHCLGDIMSLTSISPAPSAISGVLKDLMLNGVIATTCPDLQTKLLPYLLAVDGSSAELYRDIMTLSASLEKTFTFLSRVKKENNPCHAELVNLAIEALPGLWFHCSLEFIAKAVSYVLTVKDVDWSLLKMLLLKLFSHGSEEVRAVAYKQFQTHIGESLSALTLDDGCNSHLIQVILDKDILRELCTSGLACTAPEVWGAASGLFSSLIELRECPFWPQLKENLLPCLPYIEIACTECEELQELILGLLEPVEGSAATMVTSLQSSLRLMFSSNTQLRVRASSSLCKHLSENTVMKPSLQPTSPLHDTLLIGEAPIKNNHIGRQSSFKHEDVDKLVSILRSPLMDVSLKATSLEQLSLLLQDPSLHHHSLEEGVATDLIVLLRGALKQASLPASAADPEDTADDDSLMLLSPAFHCLWLLVHFSCDLRQELSDDASFLQDAFQAAMLCHGNPDAICYISRVIASLVFSSTATYSSTEDGTPVVKLPETYVKRLNLPFKPESYQIGPASPPTSSPLCPKLLSSEPSLSMLRLCYRSAMAGGVQGLATSSREEEKDDEKLFLPRSDLIAIKCLNVQTGVQQCFAEVHSASSSQEIVTGLYNLGIVVKSLLSKTGRGSDLSTADWKQLLARYLTVSPLTTEDYAILHSVLELLCLLLDHSSHITNHFLWLYEVTTSPSAVCLQLLHSSLSTGQEKNGDSQRSLQMTLLRFYTLLTQKVTSSALVFDSSNLLSVLCQCLDIAGLPNYYDLPLLESSLQCLLHLTASFQNKRLHQTTEWLTLCTKLLSSLRQVLWSFICGRGSMLASFMGKGVTSSVSLSLCHLLHAVNSTAPPEGFLLHWLQSAPDIGLSWLYFLLEDREQQVRFAGLCVMSLLCCECSTAELLLSESSQSSHFGLWGQCMEIAVDAHECSLVRQQAFFVLLSVTSLCIEKKKWEQYLCFTTEEVTLQGPTAMQALIEYSSFWTALQQLISLQSLECLRDELSDQHLEDFSSSHNPSAPVARASSTHAAQCSSQQCSNVLPFAHMLTTYCNPHVVSGACRLLHNLLLSFPEIIIAGLHNSGLIKIMANVLDNQFLKVFHWTNTSWTRMMTDILVLMQAVVVASPDAILPLLLQDDMVCRLCGLLHAVTMRVLNTEKLKAEESQALDSQKVDLLRFCSSLLALLLAVSEGTSSVEAEVVFSALQQHWSSFANLLHHSLQARSIPPLRDHALGLLCSLLVQRYQLPFGGKKTIPNGEVLRDALSFLLDGKQFDHAKHEEDSELDSGHESSGDLLCRALITEYDSLPYTKQLETASIESRLIAETLTLLLACSTAAKQCALRAGLLESSLEKMKTLHAKLCLESLEQPQQSRKRKSSPLMTELISVISLLQNLLYNSSEAKLAALTSHLPSIVLQLWPWCSINRQLLMAVLQLLSVYTARHSDAQASLANTAKGLVTLLHSILKMTSHTITSFNSCNATRGTNPHAGILRAIFILLANSALSAECRGVMKKAGFISSFPNTMPKMEKTASRRTRLSLCWLTLLTNLSFFSDGQQMVVKTPGAVDVLLDIYCTGDSGAQYHCLLVLRNLCFYGPSKALLASNQSFLSVISSSLDSGDWRLIAVAASAIGALLYNSYRIKNSLKKTNLHNKLENLYSTVKASQLSSPENDVNKSEWNSKSCCSLLSNALSLIV